MGSFKVEMADEQSDTASAMSEAAFLRAWPRRRSVRVREWVVRTIS